MHRTPANPTSRAVLALFLVAAGPWPCLAMMPGTPGPAPARSQPRRPQPTLLTRVLKAGLLGLLAAADPARLAVAQPAPAPGDIDLGGSDGVSSVAAQAVHLALARGNATGGLPPLPDLNAALATSTRPSVLATLPAQTQPQPSTTPQPQLPSLLLDQAQPRPARAELLAAARVLSVAELTEAFYLVEAIGNQLVADSVITAAQPELSQGLRIAAFELVSTGFFLAAAASHLTVEAAQEAYAKVQEQAAAAPAPAASAPAPPAQAWDPTAGLVGPDVIYGSWQRVDTAMTGGLALYKVARTELVRVDASTAPDGSEVLVMESHPGAVRGRVTYSRRGLPGEKIQVEILVDQADGTTLTLRFALLQPQPKDSGRPLEVLVEQDGQRHAFVRLSAV